MPSGIIMEQPMKDEANTINKVPILLTPIRLSYLSDCDTNTDRSGVWRKFDWRILPLTSLIYFLSFLDRSNIGNALVAGMQRELNLTNKEYSLALTATFIPYMAVELPANLVLKHIGANVMLPTLVMLWGTTCMFQGFVHNYAGLLACRFFLGLFEGGLTPCIILYLSTFYPRSILQLRISTVLATSSLAGAFSGLLAAAIVNMDGVRGKAGWAWIFILEGALTVAFGFCAFFILPRSPLEAKFLNENDKKYISDTLTLDGVLSKDPDNDNFSWTEVFQVFTQPQTGFLFVMSFFFGTLLYGSAYFEPTIVASLGHFKPVRAQLMSVPPFVVSTVLAFTLALLSDRYHARGLTLCFCSVLSIAGYAMFLGGTSKHVKYASVFFFVSGPACCTPPAATWLANNVAPHCRRASAIAVVVIAANGGGILAIWLLGSLSPPPKYTTAAITFVVFSVGLLVCSLGNLFYLWSQNRRKAEIREKGRVEDEPKGLGNQSAWFVYSL